jgi:serine protease AprX
MGGGSWRWLLLVLLILLILLLSFVLRPHCLRWGFGPRQPTDTIIGVGLPGGPSYGPVVFNPRKRTFTSSVSKPASPTPPLPAERLHPVINDWIANGWGARRERFIVVWDDAVPMPFFPESGAAGSPAWSLPLVRRRAPATANTAQLISSLRAAREPKYRTDTTGFGGLFDAKGIRSYWLIQGMLMEMPVASAVALASRPGIVYVQPDSSGEGPPVVGCTDGGYSPNASIRKARSVSGIDPYREAGYPAVWLSLLDTGVSEHTLLSTTRVVSADCVDSDDCSGSNPSDVDTYGGHGTASAVILAGNSNWTDDFEGVTRMKVRSFRVYERSGAAQLNGDAAIDAFEQGVGRSDRVIVAEIQSDAEETSGLSFVANNAYKTGAVVIAANGNYGQGDLRSPANAACAVGVGGYVLETGETVPTQSYGVTRLGRRKPELQAPSYTWTAGSDSETACKRHIETSGATPYAGGAAALLRGWLMEGLGGSTAPDAGQTIAALMLSTAAVANVGPGNDPAKIGAGRLLLPTNGRGWFGKITIDSTQDSREIDINLNGAGAKFVDVSIWWPETLVTVNGEHVERHNDIDFVLFDPDGNEAASGISADDVFESDRVESTNSLTGKWKLVVHGYDVPYGPQDVYVAVAARKNPGSTPVTVNPLP